MNSPAPIELRPAQLAFLKRNGWTLHLDAPRRVGRAKDPFPKSSRHEDFFSSAHGAALEDKYGSEGDGPYLEGADCHVYLEYALWTPVEAVTSDLRAVFADASGQVDADALIDFLDDFELTAPAWMLRLRRDVDDA